MNRSTLLFSTLIIFLSVTFALVGCTPKSVVGACTMDAKICPDGSAVGRVAPSCEFAPCPEANNTTTPTEASTFKEYKAQEPEACAIMKFTCGDEGEFFSDETGCGCIRKHTDAAVTICTADYNPVCGWFNENIKCFAYPCAVTEANLCNAATNPNVGYTTPGECPSVGNHPPTPVCGNGICESGEADACPSCYYNTPPCLAPCTAGTCPQDCTEGSNPSAPKPITDTKVPATDCPAERTQACTREYMPVCGQLTAGGSATYPNKCTACADNAVGSYYEDACPIEGSSPDGTR